MTEIQIKCPNCGHINKCDNIIPTRLEVAFYVDIEYYTEDGGKATVHIGFKCAKCGFSVGLSKEERG